MKSLCYCKSCQFNTFQRGNREKRLPFLGLANQIFIVAVIRNCYNMDMNKATNGSYGGVP